MQPRKHFAIALAGCVIFVLSGCDTSKASSLPKGAAQTSSRNPVVVELFQSQGCSSCPPANADLNAIADRRDVLALSFAVTYWDRLGWKDTFASPLFTARQEAYARAGRGEVATPEFIVNGEAAVLGTNRSALDAAIARGFAPAPGPTISANPSSVRIEAAARGAPATVWLVRYDPRTRQVPIRAGENGGRTLPHRNIVRELIRLGDWTGQAATFPLAPQREAGLVSAILVQRGSGGPIVAARKL
ncbi:DUF1223 domain-containing protein [Novosphingobium sp. G106]|uniref:DUF1223 domain-containing protein n=1 Tax=Novosphingobium sp. G106 TaxID=2849500 RepID=UPI001C2DAA10|nr:DUF1223 domain-containing protein [Novosphingobium sp. G106]MBV1686779.1 DUF1223 domain-containing protein [Novosphingobium sp. G106]